MIRVELARTLDDGCSLLGLCCEMRPALLVERQFGQSASKLNVVGLLRGRLKLLQIQLPLLQMLTELLLQLGLPGGGGRRTGRRVGSADFVLFTGLASRCHAVVRLRTTAVTIVAADGLHDLNLILQQQGIIISIDECIQERSPTRLHHEVQ